MARKAEPGILYYSMDSNHVLNQKVKLLVDEFNTDGYWIWQCLLCEIASRKGYYMMIPEERALRLFASDVCKKKMSLVNEVIRGCVRCGLFDKTVFDLFNVLTSERIQENYLAATSDRRRKSSVIQIVQEYWVIESCENDKNIQLISVKNNSSREESDNSMEESDNSMEKSDSSMPKEKESKVKERKEEIYKEAEVVANAPISLEVRKDSFKKSVEAYSEKYSPELVEDFIRYWTQKNENGVKMLFEMQKAFEIPNRLGTFKKNASRWNQKTNANGTQNKRNFTAIEDKKLIDGRKPFR